MLKTTICLACLVLMTTALGEEEQWRSFKTSFRKTYVNHKEEQTRFSVFRNNLETINAHNHKYDMGLTTYKMGINRFTDMTAEEFKTYLGLYRPKNATNNKTFKKPLGAEVPKSVNWLKKGAVTNVKNQGACGSCWSFSATGSIEGQYYVKYKKLVSLSEQNFVDCTSGYGDNGCGGGWMDHAFQYAHDYGVMSEDDYPYVAKTEVCKFNGSKSVTKVASYVDIKSGSEKDLQAAIATVGPVSVAIDATGFQMYESGILDYQFCGNNLVSLDHGVLAVGFDTENGVDYWLVKNSWGPRWGEKGYVRMSRNKKNQCGIATAASYPVL